jgi:hypothetical protein
VNERVDKPYMITYKVTKHRNKEFIVNTVSDFNEFPCSHNDNNIDDDGCSVFDINNTSQNEYDKYREISISEICHQEDSLITYYDDLYILSHKDNDDFNNNMKFFCDRILDICKVDYNNSKIIEEVNNIMRLKGKNIY